MFTSLSSILKENKLECANYIDWKRNFDIVLISENFNFVLTEECLPEQFLDSSEGEVQKYDKWVRAGELTKCYILASMSNVL